MEDKKIDTKLLLVEIQKLKEAVLTLNKERSSKHHVEEGTKNDLEDLIGTIPFFLMNEKIFEKNQDIADFAKKLDIQIPWPDKKKREDIIGRIISSIAKFDKKKLNELNSAIKSFKKSGPKKDKTNFFNDWENVIKQMKL